MVKNIINKTCEYCGELFEVNGNEKRSRNKKTCSQVCACKLGAMRNLIKTNCKICEVEMIAPKSSVNSIHGVYCSNECRNKRHEVSCIICGIKFRTDRKTVKYCSLECKNEGNKRKLVTSTCFSCKKEFKRPSFTTPSTKRVFCSKRCGARQFSIENPNRYGSKWGRIRERVVKRDNYTCQICNLKTKDNYALNVHHIVPIESFDNIDEANKMSNLQTLCYECHMDIHDRNTYVN